MHLAVTIFLICCLSVEKYKSCFFRRDLKHFSHMAAKKKTEQTDIKNKELHSYEIPLLAMGNKNHLKYPRKPIAEG